MDPICRGLFLQELSHNLIHPRPIKFRLDLLLLQILEGGQMVAWEETMVLEGVAAQLDFMTQEII